MPITWGPTLHYLPNLWQPWFVVCLIIVIVVLIIAIIHGILRMILAPRRHGEEEKEYLYPFPLRVWHWVNAILFLFLIVTAFVEHFKPHFVISLLHEIFGYILIVAWLYFVIYNVASGNGKNYIIKFRGFIGRSIKQIKFYMSGILKGENHPFEAKKGSKFNPLQQVAYILAVYIIIPVLFITGLLLLFLKVIGAGYIIFAIHGFIGIFAIAFIIIHLYLCTGGDYVTQFFKGMLDGYHRHFKEKK